jgi:hypothetical protein
VCPSRPFCSGSVFGDTEGFALFHLPNGTMLELYAPQAVPDYGYNDDGVAFGFRVDDIEAASAAVETSCSRYKPWDEIACSAGGGWHSADRTDQRLGEMEDLVTRSVWSGSSPRKSVVGLRGYSPAADFMRKCEVFGVGDARFEPATSAV